MQIPTICWQYEKLSCTINIKSTGCEWTTALSAAWNMDTFRRGHFVYQNIVFDCRGERSSKIYFHLMKNYYDCRTAFAEEVEHCGSQPNSADQMKNLNFAFITRALADSMMHWRDLNLTLFLHHSRTKKRPEFYFELISNANDVVSPFCVTFINKCCD